VNACAERGGACPGDPALELLREEGYDVSIPCAAARDEHRTQCAETIIPVVVAQSPYAEKLKENAASRDRYDDALRACGLKKAIAKTEGVLCRTVGSFQAYEDAYKGCRKECPKPAVGTVGCIPPGSHDGVSFSSIPSCGVLYEGVGASTSRLPGIEKSCECRATTMCKRYIDLAKQVSGEAVGGTSINCTAPNGEKGILRATMDYDDSGAPVGVASRCQTGSSVGIKKTRK
jgi:hypothetical protein